MLNPARDMGMVSGKRINWEQSRQGPEGSKCYMEVQKTEQKHGRAAGTDQGSGNCGAGRKALPIRAYNEAFGDVWIKLEVLLCARENGAEKL